MQHENKKILIIIVSAMTFFNALTLVEMTDYKEQILSEIKKGK